jgi:23S rRNA-/tRNA-specific pseudouridylate synthase
MRLAFRKQALYYCAFVFKHRGGLFNNNDAVKRKQFIYSWFLTSRSRSISSATADAGEERVETTTIPPAALVVQGVANTALAFATSDYVRHVLVPALYSSVNNLLLQTIEEALPSNATLTAQELVELGSIYHLAASAPRHHSHGAKPERLEAGCMHTVQHGDYLRIHFDPRRFPIAHEGDWMIPIPQSTLAPGEESQPIDSDQDGPVILGQGEGWLVVNKPAGLPVHPTVDNRLENVVACLGKANPGWSYFTPPQRLDHNTSGLLVISTNKAFAAYYSHLLRYKTSNAVNGTAAMAAEETSSRATIEKRYRCLVCGADETTSLPEKGSILRHFLEPSLRAPKRFVAAPPAGAEDWAECLTRIINSRGPFSLRGTSGEKLAGSLWPAGTIPDGCSAVAELEVELLTGRTHQIRGQLAANQMPIVGDISYGGAKNIHDNMHLEPADKLALQCYDLEFVHPDWVNATSWRLSDRRHHFRLRTAWWTTLLPKASVRRDLLPPRVQLSVGRHKYVLIQAIDPAGTCGTEWFVKSAAPAECGGAHHGKFESCHGLF